MDEAEVRSAGEAFLNRWVGEGNVKRWGAVKERAARKNNCEFICWLLDVAGDALDAVAAAAQVIDDIESATDNSSNFTAQNQPSLRTFEETETIDDETVGSRPSKLPPESIRNGESCSVESEVVDQKVHNNSSDYATAYPIKSEPLDNDYEVDSRVMAPEFLLPSVDYSDRERPNVSHNVGASDTTLHEANLPSISRYSERTKRSISHANGSMKTQVRKIHQSFPQPQNERRNPTNTSPEITIQTIGPKDRQCAQCGQLFVHAAHLRRHIITLHSNQRPFKCTACPLSFKRKDAWTQHLKLVHQMAKIFSCKICGFTVKCTDDLKKHLQEFHMLGLRWEVTATYKMVKVTSSVKP